MEEEAEEADEGAPAWMATFADMMSLLLTFFVLLLSFANMDVVQFRTMMGSVREAFGVQFEEPGDFQARAATPVSVAEGGSPNNPSVMENSAALMRLQRRLREEGLSGVVEAEESERGISLRIREAVLFPSGSAQLLPEGLPVLSRIGQISGEFTQALAIEGHTDNRPISTTRFPSNWELSAARATAVLQHLARSEAAPESMSIAGYADTRPVASNDSAEGRARNRRVEFIFAREVPAADDADEEASAEPEASGGDEHASAAAGESEESG